MMAAQLFVAARDRHPEIPDEISQGRFGTLREWLAGNVHALASSRTTGEILAGATGRGLDAANFTRHLETRYLA
jgi:Zn-dependent M32 family carboxypeptidase